MAAEESNQLLEYNSDELMDIFPTLEEQSEEDGQFANFVQQLPKGMINAKVLDIGCGTGAIAKRMASLNPQSEIIGFDVSQHFVNVANTKKPNPENAKFILMDMYHMNAEKIDDDGFDLITSIYSLHVKNPKDLTPLFKHIASKLKRNGKFKFLTNCVLPAKDRSSLSEEYLKERVFEMTLGRLSGKVWRLPNYGVLEEEVMAALAESGLRCISNTQYFDRSSKMSDDYKYRNEIRIIETIFETVLL